MESSIFSILLVRIMLSIFGVVGNGVLVISILHLAHVKTFEVFLLGLAVTNFGEIMLLDIYDIIAQTLRFDHFWSCVLLKFLNICGENGSIFFTVLISVYRYQKIHNAAMRIIAPIFMDRHDAAVGLSIACVALSVVLGLPSYFINMNSGHMENSTTGECVDVFQCSKAHCSTVNGLYKYLFIIICHVLPLIIVTLTSSLIIRILLVQQKAVAAHHEADLGARDAHHNHDHHHHDHHHQHNVFHRSTIGILAAMTLFQVYCILYLILHLVFSPHDFSAWSEMEFFVTTVYTAVIPYIYGTGHNFFSLKHFMKH